MQEPDILLADEPTSSLDPKTSVEIMELLCRLARRSGGIPVIVNIHNVELARRFAARIVGMSGGRVVYRRPARRALTERDLQGDLRRRGLAGMSDRRAHRRGPHAAVPPFRSEAGGARLGWLLLAAYVVYAGGAAGRSARSASPAGSHTAQLSSARMFPPNFCALGAAPEGHRARAWRSP